MPMPDAMPAASIMPAEHHAAAAISRPNNLRTAAAEAGVNVIHIIPWEQGKHHPVGPAHHTGPPSSLSLYLRPPSPTSPMHVWRVTTTNLSSLTGANRG
eukprot:SAG25_NODE_1189_length_3658_cov_19.857263_3_plen_99_part_00